MLRLPFQTGLIYSRYDLAWDEQPAEGNVNALMKRASFNRNPLPSANSQPITSRFPRILSIRRSTS